ncbi:MAG: hypothetical protein WCR52_05800 [Bacteroidota bacterium]
MTYFLSHFLPKRPPGSYTELNSSYILLTISRLRQRIHDRFPDSGLAKVCGDFLQVARESEKLALQLQSPIWVVRVASGVAAFMLLGLFGWASYQVMSHFSLTATGIQDLLQATESAINELIFLGLALFFLVNLEARLKRQTALKSLHRLRSIAHVVDMHQLTKDPDYVLTKVEQTENSPVRTLTHNELSRYLDYCSEILALVSKIAALFAQNMDDPIVLNAVNDLESLTQGLSGKIWQKIMILDLSVRIHTHRGDV